MPLHYWINLPLIAACIWAAIWGYLSEVRT